MSSKINHTNEGKGNEKKRERGEREEEKRLKKVKIAFLSFYIGCFRDVFGQKSLFDAQEDYLAKRS